MIYRAQDFSDFERCARIPKIRKQWEPERWPVREAVKQFFYDGLLDDPESVADRFLIEAAGRGFQYPEGEPYDLAKDYSSWIDGALRLVTEGLAPEPLPAFKFEGDLISLNGFSAEGAWYVVEVVSNLGERLRWPNIIAQLMDQPVTIVQVKLPQVTKRRLQSPLSLAYKQPITGQLRLARLDSEKISFGPAWKRIGRWEVPEIHWSEWRSGIERDRCYAMIVSAQPGRDLSKDEKRKALNDIEHMMIEMSKVHPRKWETCETCTFKGVCHDGKRGFIRKTVQRATVQREDAGEVSIP